MRENRVVRLNFLMIVLILFGVLGVACCSKSNISVDELKQQTDNECPPGSHYSKVIGYLNSKGIQHSQYQEGKLYDLTINDYIKVRTIGAQIPNAERRLFTTWSIYLSFDFDVEGKLIDVNIRKALDE